VTGVFEMELDSVSSAAISSQNGREASVLNRYASGARVKEEALCCPVQYAREHLDVIPQENFERDYGCGDPIPYIREDKFLEAFEEAGFYGIQIAQRQAEPWRTVEGIEFRSVTVVASKGKQGPCWVG
jgi:hypothetical protein